MVHICNCETEERSWHFVRLAEETILLANWYRPGNSVHDGFQNLHSEIDKFFPEVFGVVVGANLNVHQKR